MFHYGLCHMNIQEVPRVLPNSLKGWGMCYHVYVIGAYKRTHVDCQNMPNHCTSIYHEWMCVCVAALKAIVTRYTAQSVMWTCRLPRELIWERVAPSHTGVTQNSGWPLLQLLWSAPEKAQSLMWCAISNVVSLSLRWCLQNNCDNTNLIIMGVFISSNFIDLLLSSSSVVVFRCLVLRSLMSTLTLGLPVSFLSTSVAYVIPCWAWWLARWVGLCAVSTWVHTVCWRFPALMRFVLLPYGIDCLLFLQSHGLKVVWDGNVCLAHFKHLRCGCLQVKCEQLLYEFLVIEASDKSVLDVPFLFLIWWEVASVSKGMEMVNDFIWWLSGLDVNIFQLIDPAALWHCMIHCRGQVVHEGWSLLFLLWNLISCASRLPMVKLPVASVAQEIEHIFQLSQVGFCIGSSSWGCFCWNILKGEPTFHWFAWNSWKSSYCSVAFQSKDLVTSEIDGWFGRSFVSATVRAAIGSAGSAGSGAAMAGCDKRRAFWGHWRKQSLRELQCSVVS